MGLKKGLALSLFLVLILTGGLYYFFVLKSEPAQIKTFDDCLNAGYPVMEIYPRQCKTPQGEMFFESVNNLDNRDYYGSSTYYPCKSDEDCAVSGCNGEICQSLQEEDLASICLFPEDPLPVDLGYKCGCFEEKCQWFKN